MGFGLMAAIKTINKHKTEEMAWDMESKHQANR